MVFLNGEFVTPEAASISPLDRGFIFGDGVYEVIPVFNGRLFRLANHLRRLDNSLAAVGLANPLTAAQWRDVLQRLIDDQGGGDQSVYLQVTRGVAPRDHAFPENTVPTVFAYSQQASYGPTTVPTQGVAVITTEDIRWQRCDIKSTALLAAVLLRQRAVEQGGVEAILVRDGIVTEGAASNVFIVQHDEVITPPEGPMILPGITRHVVLELAAVNDIPHAERDITKRELMTATEVWITSSSQEIKPVTRIDGEPVGKGTPGPLFARVYAIYQEYKRALREGGVD